MSPRLFHLGVSVLCVALAGCASHAPSASSATPSDSAASSSSRKNDTADREAEKPSSAGPTTSDGTRSIDGRDAIGFADWVAGFRQRAEQRGVAPRTLDQAFGRADFLPRVIELDHRQPEFNRALWDYLDSAASDTRIANGRDKLSAYGDIAHRVEAKYGVPPGIITAIWGIESNYGANFGDYETIDALATLGYDGRRQAFAENQLYAALKILANGDISRESMRGSWAGAMGNTQFLPTSFIGYAVDADGDGRRDIWGSIPDTMASTANYLAKNGWQRGQAWGREVVLPAGFDYRLADGQTRRSSTAWHSAGVEPIDSRGLPTFDSAAIIAPAGASGPAFMVGPNYRAILRYNNATSYALAVGLLSDQIVGYPGVQQDWPRDEASLSRDDVFRLQRRLNTLGYDTGTPDGVVGPNTRSGLRAFQRDQGLTADGFPTQTLLDRVESVANS